MKHLIVLNKYFWKYKWRFLLGLLFVIMSNYFAVLSPEITGFVIKQVQGALTGHIQNQVQHQEHDFIVNHLLDWLVSFPLSKIIWVSCIAILLMAVIRGILMFLMRQTIIVMSRHIEYDQKNEVYAQYQNMDADFYKQYATGDLMNRMAEDVSRVRSYTGPAVMHLVNLATLIVFCVANMLSKDVRLTLITLAPLPILSMTILYLNKLINRKSQRVQALLSDLTIDAQESYSGIRVIKSFVQEKAMLGFFTKQSEAYRQNAVALARTEAIYFPSMNLIIGLSTLVTVLIGANMALHDPSKVALIVEFVIYINMLTFPVSAIGWVASMIQRAAASQERLNEFLNLRPSIQDAEDAVDIALQGKVDLRHVSYRYHNTGIEALSDFSLSISPGQKVMILGKTGSGKSTVLQLLMRFFDVDEGQVFIDDVPIKKIRLESLRRQIGYVPQDVFLFSDTVSGNIKFGLSDDISASDVEKAAFNASIAEEIAHMPEKYDTVVGERGVTLSGGQKQRISIARALIKNPKMLLLDDCLSAVDNRTEKRILQRLSAFLAGRTAIVVTHRIFTEIDFDQIIVMEEGQIAESGTHLELMQRDGHYAHLYQVQMGNKLSGE